MQPVDLLAALLSIYSPSREEHQAVAFLVETMNTLGFRAWSDAAGNAVGVLGDGPRTCVLLGHIDTVPGFIPVRTEGGRLYGRGAVDAKGPLAAFVAAAAQTAARPDRRLVVIGAVEEEAASSKGARHAAGEWNPEWCIIGEPSSAHRVTLGYKGRLLVHATLNRSMAHTAGPQSSACEEAVLFWQSLLAYATETNGGTRGVFDQLTPSLRSINSTTDGFADTVRLTVGLRVPARVSMAALRDKVAALAGDAEVVFASEEPAFRAEKNTDLVRAFLQAIRAEGSQPSFCLKTGTSDMNVVGPIWRCPIVAYGPGDSSLDHTPDEHIRIDEYLKSIAVLRRVLATF